MLNFPTNFIRFLKNVANIDIKGKMEIIFLYEHILIQNSLLPNNLRKALHLPIYNSIVPPVTRLKPRHFPSCSASLNAARSFAFASTIISADLP